MDLPLRSGVEKPLLEWTPSGVLSLFLLTFHNYSYKMVVVASKGGHNMQRGYAMTIKVKYVSGTYKIKVRVV